MRLTECTRNRRICISAASRTPAIHPQRKQPEAFDYERGCRFPSGIRRRGCIRAMAMCCQLIGAWTTAGGYGIGRRVASAVSGARRRRCPRVGSGISCCSWMAGRRIATPIRPSRRPWSRCRSTPCRGILIRQTNIFRTMRHTGNTAAVQHAPSFALDPPAGQHNNCHAKTPRNELTAARARLLPLVLSVFDVSPPPPGKRHPAPSAPAPP